MNLPTNNLGLNSLRPLLRSLLQKAVRRGYPELSKRVAFMLARHGDSAWLRSRTGIILFEECWPHAHVLQEAKPPVQVLSTLASAAKNKDAAGLGSLALAASQGDLSVFKFVHEPIAIKIVAAALKRPEHFFKWVTSECDRHEQVAVVSAAQCYFRQASWPWDKAFMAAAAYLSIRQEIPNVTLATSMPSEPFPYWVAVDKHTPQGKYALRKVASELDTEVAHLQWVSFYFESAKFRTLEFSPWWECERLWRFSELGLSLEKAETMWRDASIHMKSSVEKYADYIVQVLDASDTNMAVQTENNLILDRF